MELVFACDLLYAQFYIYYMNNKQNHLVADTPNNIKVDKSVFQKLIFLANALEQGWTVKKSNDTYIFTKKHENRQEVFQENYLETFLLSNYNADNFVLWSTIHGVVMQFPIIYRSIICIIWHNYNSHNIFANLLYLGIVHQITIITYNVIIVTQICRGIAMLIYESKIM